jgi:hypothetical protein
MLSTTTANWLSFWTRTVYPLVADGSDVPLSATFDTTRGAAATKSVVWETSADVPAAIVLSQLTLIAFCSSERHAHVSGRFVPCPIVCQSASASPSK